MPAGCRVALVGLTCCGGHIRATTHEGEAPAAT